MACLLLGFCLPMLRCISGFLACGWFLGLLSGMLGLRILRVVLLRCSMSVCCLSGLLLLTALSGFLLVLGWRVSILMILLLSPLLCLLWLRIPCCGLLVLSRILCWCLLWLVFLVLFRVLVCCWMLVLWLLWFCFLLLWGRCRLCWLLLLRLGVWRLWLC